MPYAQDVKIRPYDLVYIRYQYTRIFCLKNDLRNIRTVLLSNVLVQRNASGNTKLRSGISVRSVRRILMRAIVALSISVYIGSVAASPQYAIHRIRSHQLKNSHLSDLCMQIYCTYMVGHTEVYRRCNSAYYNIISECLRESSVASPHKQKKITHLFNTAKQSNMCINNKYK